MMSVCVALHTSVNAKLFSTCSKPQRVHDVRCASSQRTGATRGVLYRPQYSIYDVQVTYDERMHGVCVAYAWRMHGICMAYAWRMRGVCVALHTSVNAKLFSTCSKPQRSSTFISVRQRSLSVRRTYPERTQRTPSVSIRYPYVVYFSLV